MIARRKTCKGEVCETPRFWRQGDSCGFFGLRAAKDTSPSNLFSQSCNDSVCFGAMVFFSPFLWISPSSSSKNLWRCSSQIWYCRSKTLLNINWLQYGKAQVRPKIRTTLIVCHFKFLKSGQIVLNSKFAPHRPAKQRPEKNHRKLALKTKHRRLRENFRAAGSVPAWVSHPPDSPVLVGIVFGSMSNYKLRTFCSSKSSNNLYIIRTRLCVFLKCSEPPQWRWNLLSILPPRYSVRCNQPWEIVSLCIMDLQAFGFWCLILLIYWLIDWLTDWLIDWLIDWLPKNFHPCWLGYSNLGTLHKESLPLSQWLQLQQNNSKASKLNLSLGLTKKLTQFKTNAMFLRFKNLSSPHLAPLHTIAWGTTSFLGGTPALPRLRQQAVWLPEGLQRKQPQRRSHSKRSISAYYTF